MPSIRHQEILDQHEAAAGFLQRQGQELCGRVLEWLEQGQVKVHSVTHRTKSGESLAGKLARPDKQYGSLSDVTDLLGLRVIVYFEDAVEQVGDILEQRLPMALEHSIDRRRRNEGNSFGYRSLHYVCRLATTSINHEPVELCCEIQIRTMLEHAWAEIEHDLGYKSRDVVPIVARRRLNRLAGLLELADQEFVAIRADLERYAQQLPARVQDERAEVALDNLSLWHLVACPEVRTLDEQVARALGRELGEEPFYPDYLLRMLRFADLHTVSSVIDSANKLGPQALRLVLPYFEFAERTWSFSLGANATIARGYSLFFLVHARLLSGGTLRLNKVEQLARMYQLLDYPEDERTAQRIAGLLVDTLARSS